jgi:hypothetical protein
MHSKAWRSTHGLKLSNAAYGCSFDYVKNDPFFKGVNVVQNYSW